MGEIRLVDIHVIAFLFGHKAAIVLSTQMAADKWQG
jgi:hypothetical protein